MRTYIPESATTVESVSTFTDDALRSIASLAKSGTVSNSVKSENRSQLFDDDGVLKFYSALTGETTELTTLTEE